MLGAAAGWFLRLPQRAIASAMAFGAGVLISALSFELMGEARAHGGLAPAALGFLGGALLYTFANVAVARLGARHRKRSGQAHPAADEAGGTALAIGALLDGVPESLVIGISLLSGGTVSVVTVAAVFLSNLPEGLSSAAGMKSAGRSFGFVALLWSAIALASAAAAFTGYTAFDAASPPLVATVQALAAGAILAMIVDTMVPEATHGTHDYAGLIAVAGFLAAFALSSLG